MAPESAPPAIAIDSIGSMSWPSASGLGDHPRTGARKSEPPCGSPNDPRQLDSLLEGQARFLSFGSSPRDSDQRYRRGRRSHHGVDPGGRATACQPGTLTGFVQRLNVIRHDHTGPATIEGDKARRGVQAFSPRNRPASQELGVETFLSRWDDAGARMARTGRGRQPP